VSTLVKIVYRPQVSGAHHIPATGPCIIAANHLSFSDHVFISLATRRPVVFIGKAERLTGTGLRGRLGAAFFRAI
jgi:1-acyl-sn-glycerol-3-phosphate acyltransferase